MNCMEELGTSRHNSHELEFSPHRWRQNWFGGNVCSSSVLISWTSSSLFDEWERQARSWVMYTWLQSRDSSLASWSISPATHWLWCNPDRFSRCGAVLLFCHIDAGIRHLPDSDTHYWPSAYFSTIPLPIWHGLLYQLASPLITETFATTSVSNESRSAWLFIFEPAKFVTILMSAGSQGTCWACTTVHCGLYNTWPICLTAQGWQCSET